jgi:hypothetical protein
VVRGPRMRECTRARRTVHPARSDAQPAGRGWAAMRHKQGSHGRAAGGAASAQGPLLLAAALAARAHRMWGQRSRTCCKGPAQSPLQRCCSGTCCGQCRQSPASCWRGRACTGTRCPRAWGTSPGRGTTCMRSTCPRGTLEAFAGNGVGGRGLLRDRRKLGAWPRGRGLSQGQGVFVARAAPAYLHRAAGKCMYGGCPPAWWPRMRPSSRGWFPGPMPRVGARPDPPTGRDRPVPRTPATQSR